MRSMMRTAGFWLLLAIAAPLAVLAPAQAQAQDRQLIVTPDSDYAGYDYKTVKDVTAEACQAACRQDGLCRAFTYNTSARWCFLKSDFGPLSVAPGAIAGRVVTRQPPTPTLEQQRLGELNFLPGSYVDEARRFAGSLATVFRATDEGYAKLLAGAVTARDAGEPGLAAIRFGRALALAPEDPQAWIDFGLATLGRSAKDYNEQQQIRTQSTAAAVNAYLRSSADTERAGALNLLGAALAKREVWRPAIKAYRASLAIEDNPVIASTLETMVAQHGFHVETHTVDADAASPRICVVFSDPLPVDRPDLTDFVTVEGGEGLAVEPEGNQICVDGVKHGGRYTIRLRAGLPAADGETLYKTSDLEVFVRDRAPWVGFAGNAYVLPAGKGATIPIESVNATSAEAVIYRIGDRGLAGAVRNGTFLSQLEGYRASEIADSTGEQVWEGRIEIPSRLNEMMTTAIPIEDAVNRLEPGVYVITARVPDANQEYWQAKATQWFIVSDLGLTALSANDGIHTLVRSLSTARAAGGVKVRLIATNNEVLGEAVTNDDGYARFEPGLARGTGGMAPQLVVAETGSDYAFLDLNKSAFDLTDRGVTGRPAPGVLDAYMTTERGIYRPGETVFMTALLRDSRANAVKDLPLTVVVERPDGVEQGRASLSDRGAGGYFYTMVLQDDAMRGSWHLKLYSDPKAAPLADQAFLVEDFEPERLAFELSTAATAFTPDEPVSIEVAARYLWGAAAPDLSVSGDIVVTPTGSLPAYPGYVFGRVDDTVGTIREPIDASAVTDADGKATLDVALPELPTTTKLFTADAVLRLTDTNGRAIERKLTLPVLADGPRIGIRNLFEDGAPEGGPAQFQLIAVGPDGARIAMPGTRWTIEQVLTNYQWYNANGSWRWETITSTRRIADGTVDITADQPVTISAPVNWGEYRIEVSTEGDTPTSSSNDFYAGWYVAGAGTDTPDVLQVALDKPSYRVGDTARLRLEPRFAGIALVTVVDDRLISMKSVEVPAEGTSIDLPITADWGPGAYVTATLYRPMDIEAKRMPARALGLTWAKVEPGDRDLEVALDLPTEVRPRGPLMIPVHLANLKPGTEAYVTVAAVDLGILNLTNYQPPAPDNWYFGQRQLGVDIRDLYGALIDRMAGLPGRLRSGGDGGPTRLGAPPPTQKLLAYHSGIVRVDENGNATISFDMPDFNGTVRVMAEAWSAEGVGHAYRDVFVRDPVVVATSVPRFLHVGDSSRLLVEMNNVSGTAGDYRLLVEADAGIGMRPEDGNRTVTLAAGARATLAMPITGDAVGDHQVRLTLVTPDGTRLPKDFLLGVRPSGEPVSRRNLVALAPNGGSLSLDAEVLAEFQPGTTALTVSAGGAAGLDVPAILAALDRYPYGCAEQLTSRALPLLYLDEVAASVGIGADSDVHKRIQDAVEGVLAKQASSGGFGLWGPYDDNDFWLDAYVTDFLTRAAAKGYDVPELARTQALDNLSNHLAYVQDFDRGGEDIAYALYVLARAGRASIGDLRYYAESKIDAFSTPLAKAQLGAALAMYGDQEKAARAFRAALAALPADVDDPTGWRTDYGTGLRDEAAVLTLAAESSQPEVDLRSLVQKVAARRQERRYTSTQEDAWSLLAAAALLRDVQDTRLTVGGVASDGPVFRRFTAEALATPVSIVNNGDRPVTTVVTATGIPTAPEPEGGNGFTIVRTYYTPDGTAADIATVAQNDRFIVTLTVTATAGRTARLLVVDPLPAGFEIENPDISASGDVSQYPWLTTETNVAHTEARTDRFVAALNRYSSDPVQFTVAYTVRAVSPGKFSHPGAVVEDMYRPDRRANTAASSVEVVGATR